MLSSSFVITSILLETIIFELLSASISEVYELIKSKTAESFSFSFAISTSSSFCFEVKNSSCFVKFSISCFEFLILSALPSKNCFNFSISAPSVLISRSRLIRLTASLFLLPPVIEPCGFITSPSKVTILKLNFEFWASLIATSKLLTITVAPSRFEITLSISFP